MRPTTIHPLAGQGVNIGFKDVSELSRQIRTALLQGKAWDSDELLEEFEAGRRRDNQGDAIDHGSLFPSLWQRSDPLYWLRNAGLWLYLTAGLAKLVLRYALGL